MDELLDELVDLNLEPGWNFNKPLGFHECSGDLTGFWSLRFRRDTYRLIYVPNFHEETLCAVYFGEKTHDCEKDGDGNFTNVYDRFGAILMHKKWDHTYFL